MSLLSLFINLVIVLIGLWLINAYIPMTGKIKKILNVAALILVVLWLVNASGVVASLSKSGIGR